MLKKILAWFSQPQKQKPFSKWENIPVGDLKKGEPYIDHLYNRVTDGYIIQNVLNETEVKELVSAFENLDAYKAVHFEKREGFINPRAFSQIQNENEFDFDLLNSYLNDAEWFAKFLKERLSFNIKEKLLDTLAKLQNNVPITIPNYSTGGTHKAFTFATYRFLKPDKGGMHIHCGSMFREIYPNFYKQLDKIINFDGQLSYFLMLQRPEKGGQLRLFDAEWKDYKKHFDGLGFVNDQEQVKAMNETIIQDIDPKPGDLLIFVGGDIWHEVTNPELGLPRITLGGFLAYSNKRDEIYVWS